jgi:hypothetical protein
MRQSAETVDLQRVRDGGKAESDLGFQIARRNYKCIREKFALCGTHGQTFSFQTMTKRRARALENRKFEHANGTRALGCRGKLPESGKMNPGSSSY